MHKHLEDHLEEGHKLYLNKLSNNNKMISEFLQETKSQTNIPLDIYYN